MDLSLLKSVIVIKSCYLNLLSLVLKIYIKVICCFGCVFFCCMFWYMQFCGRCNSQRRTALFIGFCMKQTIQIEFLAVCLTQHLVLELISQLHCRLETYSLVRRNSLSQIFSTSTLLHVWQLHGIYWAAFDSLSRLWTFSHLFLDLFSLPWTSSL